MKPSDQRIEIKQGMAEGLILIYLDPKTNPKLKQKILEELFDRLVWLESLKQAIENRKIHYQRWLDERGYFDKWDSIEDLIKGRDDAYQLGIASGIYDVCDSLIKIVEKREGETTR